MAENKQIIGVLGATSLVGKRLIPLLSQSSRHVIAFSREEKDFVEGKVEWQKLASNICPEKQQTIDTWVCLMPIWVLLDYFNLLDGCGVKKVVVLSSTSRFTKKNSSDNGEQAIARRLMEGEEQFKKWAIKKGVEWVILRPTMIYGFGEDKNISEVADFICRWHFFPILGEGKGLRQPIHVDDVATFCQTAIFSKAVEGNAFNICGGETLSYKKMIERVFGILGKSPRFVYFPRSFLLLAVPLLNLLPKFKNVTVSIMDRMDDDLIFGGDVAKELGVSPRPFDLSKEDLPKYLQKGS